MDEGTGGESAANAFIWHFVYLSSLDRMPYRAVAGKQRPKSHWQLRLDVVLHRCVRWPLAKVWATPDLQLRQIGLPSIWTDYSFALWHIAYQYAGVSAAKQRGMGSKQNTRFKMAARQDRPSTFRGVIVLSIRNDPKEADATLEGPSYNSNWQPSRSNHHCDTIGRNQARRAVRNQLMAKPAKTGALECNGRET